MSTHRISSILAAGLLLFCAGCFEPLQIELTVHSTGEGEATLSVMDPYAAEQGTQPPALTPTTPWGGVVWRRDVGLRWLGSSGRIADIAALDLQGFRVAKWEQQPDGGWEMIVELDVRPDSPFLKRINMTPDQYARLEQLFLYDDQGLKAPDKSDQETVKLEINLPGEMKESKVLAGKRELKSVINERQSELTLDARTLISGGYGKIVWRMRCGPETAEAKRARRKFHSAEALRSAGVETLGVGVGDPGAHAGKTVVFHDADAWQAFLEEHKDDIRGVAAYEPIHFDRQIVLVSWGQNLPHGRYAFAVIEELKQEAGAWILRVVEREISRGYPVGELPFHIARIPKPEHPLEVHREQEARE